jgi:hypothetical protein
VLENDPEPGLQCPGVRRGLPGKSGTVAGLDGRRRAARRLRAIAADMEAQLPKPLTDAQLALVKRASELALAAELARGQLVRGEPVAIAEVVKLENLAARAWRDLGLDRRREHVGLGALLRADRDG